MKKYLLLIPLVFLLLLSGCGPDKLIEKRADVSSFFNNINASFSAQFGDIETEGHFIFTPESLAFEFTSPKTVNGLKISADSQCVTFSYNDLSFTKQNTKLSEQFNVFAVYSALNSARNTGTLSKLDGKAVVSGDGFEITLDGENKVSQIEIPEKRINIKLEW